MDQQRLRNLVFEKTGVKVDSDDPIFALVALNEVVLAETVERHVALIEAATRALTAAAGAPSATPAATVAATAATPATAPAVTGTLLLAPREIRLLSAAAGVALLTALLVLAGQALLTKPAPVPLAPPISAPAALTAEQQGAIDDGKKLAAAVQKLDAKTRGLIQAELKKP
jgi:hypothetical protein